MTRNATKHFLAPRTAILVPDFMIALLAAVPEETKQIRDALSDLDERVAGGLPMTTGTVSGQEICLTHSGIGKAAAAAAAITLLNNCRADALILFGCGGAYPNSGLQISDLALADGEIFGDDGVVTASGFQDLSAMELPMREASSPLYNCWDTDTELTKWAGTVLTGIQKGPFVTVSSCTGTTDKALEIEKRTGGICENMEGAAVALACSQLSVPMLEIRGISNLVEDRDTSRWDLPAGMSAAQDAVLKLLTSWKAL